LLLVGTAVYVAIRILAMLSLVVIPVLAALVITTLLKPITRMLGHRMPGPLSAALTLLLAVLVIGGIGYAIDLRFVQQLPSLTTQLVDTMHRIRTFLSNSGVADIELDNLERSVIDWLERNRSQAVGYLTTSAGYLLKFLTAVVLTLFVTFFLLYDGERIWRWLIMPFPPRTSHRVDLAGRAAWITLTHYVHGTVIIGAIHGTVIGFTLFLLGVPLAIPLAVLVFVGSLIPLIGALVAGGLAVLITFGTQGWLTALILLAVLLVENQLEAHLLQPLIVGRYLQLHPLAVGLALAAGTVLGGIIGAIVAVPCAAVVYRSLPLLRGRARSVSRLATGAGRPAGGRG